LKTPKGTVTVEKDKHINPDVNVEGMAKLHPAFKKDETVRPEILRGLMI
jgi:acetyl-CoA acetyltransferase